MPELTPTGRAIETIPAWSEEDIVTLENGELCKRCTKSSSLCDGDPERCILEYMEAKEREMGCLK
jgi:tRNA G26 N,N-dimethylase Trm1